MGISSYYPNSRISQPGVCTSTTRPASPYEGQVIYETDSKNIKLWSGSVWQNISVAQTGTIDIYAGLTAPSGWLLCAGQTVSRTTYSDLFGIISPSQGTVTITIATPAVVSQTGHPFATGDAVYLTTTGALPTGLSINTLYYIIRVDANSYNLATSRANAAAGTKINTSGSQSGTHTLFACPYGLGDGTTTFNVPDLRGRVAAGRDNMNTVGTASADRLTNPAATTGGLDGDILGNTGGSETHTLTTAQLASHTHLKRGVILAGTGSGFATAFYGGHDANNPTSSTGSDAAHNNVQPTMTLNFIIKT